VLTAPLGLATRLSEVARRSRPAPARWTALARASLGLGLAAMTTGCLITDPPQFKAQKHTRPFLVEATADPDPSRVKVVDAQPFIPFSAVVISQDDPADSTSSDFRQVHAWLYIDYGLTALGSPLAYYRYLVPPNALDVGATLDDTNRRLTATWYPGINKVEPGCHTATLVVSHKFDDHQCPACDDDWSSITWQLLRCSDSNGDCGALPVSGDRSCEDLKNSCTLVHNALGADAGASACPSETEDGGAQ
jgi:hypothetical protein